MAELRVKTKVEAIELGLRQFYPDEPCTHGHVCDRRIRKDGLSECGDCARKRCSDWRKANKERVAQYNAQWYRDNVEYKSQTSAARYQEDPEKYRQKTKDWKTANPDKVKPLTREYWEEYYSREGNRERARDNHRRWAENNPEQIKEFQRRSRAKNPDRGRKDVALRRARQHQACPLWVDQKTIRQIYRDCPEGYHIDHDVPLKHPLVCGLHVPANLVPLPANENQKKSNKFDPETYVHEFPKAA